MLLKVVQTVATPTFAGLCYKTWESPRTTPSQDQHDNMRARWYDTQSGVFTSVDPAVSSTNQPYQFANGDPVNNSDPSGDYSQPPSNSPAPTGHQNYYYGENSALINFSLGLNADPNLTLTVQSDVSYFTDLTVVACAWNVQVVSDTTINECGRTHTIPQNTSSPYVSFSLGAITNQGPGPSSVGWYNYGLLISEGDSISNSQSNLQSPSGWAQDNYPVDPGPEGAPQAGDAAYSGCSNIQLVSSSGGPTLNYQPYGFLNDAYVLDFSWNGTFPYAGPTFSFPASA
ncbi:MAG: RHS repeat-associated core domain-containing protein [Acidimicrobiales bacterium]